LAGHDLARVPEAAEVRERLPDPLRPESEREHAHQATLVEDRAGDEGQWPAGTAVPLEAAEIGLQQRLSAVETDRQFGVDERARHQRHAGRDLGTE